MFRLFMFAFVGVLYMFIVGVGNHSSKGPQRVTYVATFPREEVFEDVASCKGNLVDVGSASGSVSNVNL